MLTCYAMVALATPSYRYTIPQYKAFVKLFLLFFKKHPAGIGVILLAGYHANSIRLRRVILLRSVIRLTPSDIRYASF